MRTSLLALVAIGSLTACVSKKSYDELVLEQQRINEQKDSLVSDVLATTAMVTEINADLARVKGLGMSPVSSSGERPVAGAAEDRAVLLGKIREVISRLTAAEELIEQQKQRVGQLTEQRRRLVAQLEAFQGTIEELKATALQQEALITEQREQIKTLASRVDTLTQETDRLAGERQAIADTLQDVIDETNIVYYVVGTKDELLEKGVVVEEGSKFLVFGSKTLQPARQLEPDVFQRLDRRVDTVLTVPEPTKEYKIVTRQDPQFLASTVTNKGKVKGDLHISSQSFWDGGKFLILVRD
jgi:flagellar biosynthesis/type III secretory pathway chaperone